MSLENIKATKQIHNLYQPSHNNSKMLYNTKIDHCIYYSSTRIISLSRNITIYRSERVNSLWVIFEQRQHNPRYPWIKNRRSPLFFSAPLLPFAQSLMVILVHFLPIRPVLVMAHMEITRPCWEGGIMKWGFSLRFLIPTAIHGNWWAIRWQLLRLLKVTPLAC